MKLVIETYWNKVEHDGSFPFGTRVLDDYERRGVTVYPGDPRTQKEFRRECRAKHDFIGFMKDGSAKFDLGRYYGIHSYQLVRLEDE